MFGMSLSHGKKKSSQLNKILPYKLIFIALKIKLINTTFALNSSSNYASNH
jgi:hypothetical protein